MLWLCLAWISIVLRLRKVDRSLNYILLSILSKCWEQWKAMHKWKRASSTLFLWCGHSFLAIYNIIFSLAIWTLFSCYIASTIGIHYWHGSPFFEPANIFDMKNIGVATPTLQEWCGSGAWLTSCSNEVLLSLVVLVLYCSVQEEKKKCLKGAICVVWWVVMLAVCRAAEYMSKF